MNSRIKINILINIKSFLNINNINILIKFYRYHAKNKNTRLSYISKLNWNNYNKYYNKIKR